MRRKRPSGAERSLGWPLSARVTCDSGTVVTGVGRRGKERGIGKGPRPWGIRGALVVSGALFCTALAALVSTGCSRSAFDGRVYRSSEFSFRLGPIPTTARQVDASEALVAFRDDQAGSTIAVSARCGQDGDDVPLRSLVQHLFIHFTNRRIVREEEFSLARRAALETELDAALDGVSSHFVVVVTKHDGCVYDFVHVDGGGNGPAVQQSRTDFRAMVRGFEVLH